MTRRGAFSSSIRSRADDWRALAAQHLRDPKTASARAKAPAALPAVARRRIYALCGRPVAVRFAARAVEALVAPRFGWSERPDLAPVATLTVGRCRRGFVLRDAGVADTVVADAVAMSGLLTRRIAELGYGRSDWLAVLHGAAVADERGAIVLPGPNGAGKSTLTAALVARGHGYYSDDCVPIDGSGLVRPVPFALCHKDRSGPRLRLSYRAPVGATPLPARPCLFAFPRYGAGLLAEARRLAPREVLERLVDGRAWLPDARTTCDARSISLPGCRRSNSPTRRQKRPWRSSRRATVRPLNDGQ